MQFNRAIIAQHEAYAAPESGWPDEVRLMVSSARIALAALTAEPVFQVLGSVWRDSTREVYERCLQEGLTGRVLYTTPPVAAPAVPDEAFIDKVCLTAAEIFGQNDPDEAQEIVNRIRAMLAAAPEKRQ
ncbi:MULTISPECIES: hypothetical protein [unclassified Pantoea]|uniref:hypothetical protein n=1 Tax=unclassified Pantoea TaxID=2630326 RepID=UPI00257D157F|nr:MULTISPECIES: hypothetical protein [unclassified Pantoea]MDU5473980.1 hypothetical protein [Pantoea sp.]